MKWSTHVLASAALFVAVCMSPVSAQVNSVGRITPPEVNDDRPGTGGTDTGGISTSSNSDQDACGALLCLAGVMLTGSTPDKCSGYIKKYFAIVSFKNGDFSPSKTLKARTNFLNQCTSGDGQSKSNVNNRYGKSLGL
jgi:hypothetical protein